MCNIVRVNLGLSQASLEYFYISQMLNMCDVELIEIEEGFTLSCETEMHSRGNCFICLDRRRQYMIIGQRLAACVTVISELLGIEDVKLSSLYSAASRSLRKGRHMSWEVEKLPIAELQSFVESKALRYERVIVAACQPRAWKVTPSCLT